MYLKTSPISAKVFDLPYSKAINTAWHEKSQLLESVHHIFATPAQEFLLACFPAMLSGICACCCRGMEHKYKFSPSCCVRVLRPRSFMFAPSCWTKQDVCPCLFFFLTHSFLFFSCIVHCAMISLKTSNTFVAQVILKNSMYIYKAQKSKQGQEKPITRLSVSFSINLSGVRLDQWSGHILLYNKEPILGCTPSHYYLSFLHWKDSKLKKTIYLYFFSSFFNYLGFIERSDCQVEAESCLWSWKELSDS